VGEPFDPEIHEPVGAPGGTNDLVVASELRRGYRLRDRVLRPAMVMLEARE
jgi:molecular chaperone GrpE